MSDNLSVALISGLISLIGTFGSILLTHRLNQRGATNGVAVDQSSDAVAPAATGWWTAALLIAGLATGYVSNIRLGSYPITGSADPFKSVVYVAPVLALLTLWLRARAARRSFMVFALDMLVLWAATATGICLVMAHLFPDALRAAVLMCGVSLAIGAIVFWLTGKGRRSA